MKEEAGQVCCVQPSAVLWDCSSLSQQQPGPEPPGDSGLQGVTAPQAVQPHCCGTLPQPVTSSSLLDTLSQPQRR